MRLYHNGEGNIQAVRRCRSYLDCGRDCAKAISCGCRGRLTTARPSRFGRAKTITKKRPRGVTVVIPVGAPLGVALDAAALVKRSPIVLTNLDGQPWKGFSSYFGKVRKRAGVIGVTFNDLRGTAVTRLALVGCSEAEIATITGHSLRDVRPILDANYLHRDPALAESAIRKLDLGTTEPVVQADADDLTFEVPRRVEHGDGRHGKQIKKGVRDIAKIIVEILGSYARSNSEGIFRAATGSPTDEPPGRCG
jgi:hypothetical protein